MVIIEMLTPDRDEVKVEESFDRFASQYRAILEAGYIACIADNPMGKLGFLGIDVLGETCVTDGTGKADGIGGQLMLTINAYHTMPVVNNMLDDAAGMGIKRLLVVTGDGSARLPRLRGFRLGDSSSPVTSVDLVRYIKGHHTGFECGVVYDQYKPQLGDKGELAKLEAKVKAGADFIVTRPVVCRVGAGHGGSYIQSGNIQSERVRYIAGYGLPVVVHSWMSKHLDLLSDIVGYDFDVTDEADGMGAGPGLGYDPVSNVSALRREYPDCGLYLSLLGFKTQLGEVKRVIGGETS